MRTARSHRRRLRLLASLGLGLGVGLVLAEAAVRVLDPPLDFAGTTIEAEDGTRLPMSDVLAYMRRLREESGSASRAFRCRFCYDRPGRDYFDEDGCVPVVSNSLGLRDDEIGPRRPGELRVLAVGDSFTFGFGVRAEDAWPAVFERLLGADRPDPVQVVNAGFAGGSFEPEGYAAWLAAEGLALEPDWVLFALCPNDVHLRVPMASLPRPEPPVLGGVSRLLVELQEALARRRHAALIRAVPEDVLERRQLRFLTDDGYWERAQRALLDARDRLRAADVRFTVVVFPMLTQLAGRYPYPLLHRAVVDFCADAGIECVDLLPRLRAHARETPGFRDADAWVHPTDQHPAPPILRLLTEELYARTRAG